MLDITFTLLVPIFLGFFAGYYLDKRLNNEVPVWTIAFTVLGVVVGMWSVYRRYGK